jgi:trigger factor
MEVSVNDINDVQKEIHIIASPGDLIPHFEEAYKREQPKIEIKGFRKGKAPLDLVKKVYGESIEYGALDHIASDIFREVAEERHIHPIGEPVLIDMHFHRGEPLSFKVKYELKPAVTLAEYKGIPAEKLIHIVTEKEVTEELLRLRKSNSTMAEAASAPDEEHVITVDVQHLDESGAPMIGKKTPGARIYLADETVYPEIKKALAGAALGENRRAVIEIDQDGKKQVNRLDMSVTKIEKIVLPELTDEFVKTVTKEKVTSADTFVEQLKKDLDSYWKDRSERQLLDSIIGEIVRRHEINVPESLVKGFLDSMLEDTKKRYPNKKLPAEFDEREFREQNRSYAVFQAKWYLIRERLIEAEGLTVEDADMERLAEADAPKVGIDKESLMKFYATSEAMKDRVLSEKLHVFLKEHAAITETTTEEPIE